MNPFRKNWRVKIDGSETFHRTYADAVIRVMREVSKDTTRSWRILRRARGEWVLVAWSDHPRR